MVFVNTVIKSACSRPPHHIHRTRSTAGVIFERLEHRQKAVFKIVEIAGFLPYLIQRTKFHYRRNAMNIQVTFRHIPPSGALKQYAEEKITKLIKSLKEPIEVHIIFTQEKKNNTVELTLKSAGKELYAKERGLDMYAAIDLIYDKLDKQITKLKEKKKKHTGVASMKHLPQTESAEEDQDNDEVMVIPEKDYFVRPMTTEEAVLQLDISETPFLVYLDAGAEKVNVVFRRDDGHFGLIETGARYK